MTKGEFNIYKGKKVTFQVVTCFEDIKFKFADVFSDFEVYM